jgi:hypothetical protein
MPFVDREDMAQAAAAEESQKEKIKAEGSRGQSLAGFLDAQNALTKAQMRAVDLGRPAHEIVGDSCTCLAVMICSVAGTIAVTQTGRKPTPDEILETAGRLMAVVQEQVVYMADRFCAVAMEIRTHEGSLS